MSRLRVAIVQEYVPRYRVKLFTGLINRLCDFDIDCFVVAGHPGGAQAVRGDAAEDLEWLRLADPRRIEVGNRTIRFYGSDKHWRDCDGVVMELRGTSLDLHRELLIKRFSGRRVGVWGHVKPFTNPGHPVDLAVERRQMRRSDHVFAYTKSGAEFARAAGVETANVTPVMNSTDVSNVLKTYESLQPEEIGKFQERHGLTPGKTFGYIGGLDASKRVDFLVDVLDVLWQLDPAVKVLIGGKGDQENLLSPAAQRGQAILLGYVGAQDKAMISRVSQGLLNPGRVGLLAVECIALGVPILSTDWEFHAPEYEYLTPGDDVFVSHNGVKSYAELVLSRTSDNGEVRHHQAKQYPSIDDMILNFTEGIKSMMA
jgi:glycosyltransferase involved in cell wall biosynthesis